MAARSCCRSFAERAPAPENAARAASILAELEGRGEVAGPFAYYRAEILATMGRKEEAIDSLYAAYRERHPLLVFAGVKRGLDALRDERRFHDLLLRIRLPRAVPGRS
jgi:hypothetical protein